MKKVTIFQDEVKVWHFISEEINEFELLGCLDYYKKVIRNRIDNAIEKEE